MKKLMFIFIMLSMCTGLAFPQTATATLTGSVYQADGAPIKGVKVTFTADAAGKKIAKTSKQGNFRFPGLPPGEYDLKLEKDGFKPVIFRGIRLFVGKDKGVKITMQTGPATPPEIIEEESERAVVYNRSKSIAVNIGKKKLRRLPTARNPWTIINLVPGMLLDREDVGGSESGMQYPFHGLGANPNDTTWYIDGVNITHPETIGTAPAYLDTNNFEEIQVSLGANDITAQTGGTQLNFVSKRGGNRLSGNFHFYVEDDALEMKQDLPESMIDLGLGSPGIFRLYQYGANLGGPIIKNKLWFFGSYAIQDIHAKTIEQNEDATWINGKYVKIDFQFGKTSGYLKFSNDNKKKWDKYSIEASNQAPKTAWDQTSPHLVYQASLQHEIGNLTLNGKLAYVDSSFTLNPKSNKLNNNYIITHEPGPDWFYYRVPNKYWTGSHLYYTTNTESRNFSLDGNYFIESFMGTDHEIRFGVDYYSADTTSQTLYPNQRTLFVYDRNNPQFYKEIWWRCDNVFDVGFKRTSIYLCDALYFGSLTANIGLRYDRETGSFNETTVQGLTFNGLPIFADYKIMGDLSIPAGSIPAAFEVLSPRISLTYDINGNGKNVLKATYARYGSQAGNSFARLLWPVGLREVDVYWDDKDNNLEVDWGEWSEEYPYFWGPLPWIIAPENFNKIDPDYNSPLLTELTLAFEKALGEDFIIVLNAYYKKRTNLTWDRGMFKEYPWWRGSKPRDEEDGLETAENWYEAGDYVFEDGTTKPFYRRYYEPNAIYRTNHSSGTYNTYKALQLVLSKKLYHGWMLDASLTLSDWKSHYDPDEYFDKTNFAFFDGGSAALESEGSGLSGVYVNARWQLKIAGLVQLPYGFNLTGVFQAREGYIIPNYELLKRGGGLGWTQMYEPGKKFGDSRLPAFRMLNLGLEKSFNISSTAAVTLFVNGYNITNNSTTLQVNPLLSSSSSGEVRRVLNPGIFQFGVRVKF